MTLQSRNLKRVVVLSGMPIGQFAHKVGMSPQNLDRISKGGATKLSTAQRIIKVLNEECFVRCSLDDIDIVISGEEEE